MKEMTRKAKAIAAAFGVILAAAPATTFAQLSTTANGPYYATPSWDQKLTTNRFVILANWNNEAVLDRETGVVWQRSPVTDEHALFFGTQLCHLASTGGRRGWRLPRAEELASLLEPDPITGMATLPAGHPFIGIRTNSGDYYWSATRSADFPGSVWVVSFYNGAGGPYSSSTRHLWCARGGQGVDTQ